MFDHLSVLEQEPIGTIAAFAAAFPPDSSAALVVNAEHDPAGRSLLRGGAPRTPMCGCSRAISRRPTHTP
jgi:hypothetical protein